MIFDNACVWFVISCYRIHLTLNASKFNNYKLGNSANAIPHYQKLNSRVNHKWINRKGQASRSAMVGLHLGGTIFLIVVASERSKYVIFTLWLVHMNYRQEKSMLAYLGHCLRKSVKIYVTAKHKIPNEKSKLSRISQVLYFIF